jgi:hypothetical protein
LNYTRGCRRFVERGGVDGIFNMSMIQFIAFVRRNLLVLLFGCLIMAQILTWRAIVSLQETVDYYGCGKYDSPCKMVIVPDKKK